MLKRLLLSAASAALLCAAPAYAQNIRIAILGPMAFVQGENHWSGAEMGRDEINRTGGIRVGGTARQVEIIKVDTNEIQNVSDATNAMERAITREKADFLIGGFRSEAVLAMQEIAMDNKKLFLGAGAAHSKLGLNVEQNYERYKYWFRLTPVKDVDLVRSLYAVLNSVGQQIRTELKKDKPRVAIFAEKALWTEALVKSAQATLPKMGMEVVGLWQSSDRATDVTAELSAIKRAGADIVYTIVSGPVGIVLGRQMGELQLPAIAFGINVEAQKEGFWQATAGKANYVSTLDTLAEVEITPKTLSFVHAFRERFKRMPTYNAATYDGMLLLREAIQQADSLDPDKIVPVIEKMEYVAAAALVTFDKRHDLVWAVGKTAGIAVQWQDGKKVAFWPPQVKGTQPFKMPK